MKITSSRGWQFSYELENTIQCNYVTTVFPTLFLNVLMEKNYDTFGNIFHFLFRDIITWLSLYLNIDFIAGPFSIQ